MADTADRRVRSDASVRPMYLCTHRPVGDGEHHASVRVPKRGKEGLHKGCCGHTVVFADLRKRRTHLDRIQRTRRRVTTPSPTENYRGGRGPMREPPSPDRWRPFLRFSPSMLDACNLCNVRTVVNQQRRARGLTEPLVPTHALTCQILLPIVRVNAIRIMAECS